MILILGRAAAGKDALADALAEQGVSVVGRPADSLDPTSEIVKADDQSAQARVISPNELDELCSNKSDIRYHIIYVIAAENAARLTMAELAFDPQDGDAKEKVESRERVESPIFDDLEQRIQDSAEKGTFLFPEQVGSIRVFVNDYQPTSLAETCAKILLEKRLRKNVLRIIRDAAFKFHDIRCDDDGHIITESAEGDPTPQTPEAVADAYVANPEMLGPTMLAWLRHVDLTKMKDVPTYTDDIVLQQ